MSDQYSCFLHGDHVGPDCPKCLRTSNEIGNPVAERARAYRNERGHWGSHAEALCNEVDRLQALLTRTLGLVTNPVPLMQPVETDGPNKGDSIPVFETNRSPVETVR